MDRNTACVHRCKRRKKKKISRDPTNATRCFMPRARDPATLDATALFPFADGSSPPLPLLPFLVAARCRTWHDTRPEINIISREPARSFQSSCTQRGCRSVLASLLPCLARFRSNSGRLEGWWKMEEVEQGGFFSLCLFASPLLLKLQIFLFDQSGRNSLILLEKLIVKRHLFKNVFHRFLY